MSRKQAGLDPAWLLLLGACECLMSPGLLKAVLLWMRNFVAADDPLPRSGSTHLTNGARDRKLPWSHAITLTQIA